jgi:hypothetical protein
MGRKGENIMSEYTINQAAEMINRSPKTIMEWEKQGLITPERDDRGWRKFSDRDLELLEEIKVKKIAVMMSGGKGEDDAGAAETTQHLSETGGNSESD